MQPTYKIEDLRREVATGRVLTVLYLASKTQDGHTVSIGGAVDLPPKAPEDPDFVPFESLTEATVLDWLMDQIGPERVEQIDADLDAQLDAALNPVQAPGLPWPVAAPAAPEPEAL